MGKNPEDDKDKRDIPVKVAGEGGENNFLDLLRASNPGAYHGNENDDTLRAGNGSGPAGGGHRQTPSNLSDLFDPPPPQDNNSSLNGQFSYPPSPVSPPSSGRMNVHPPAGAMMPPRPPQPSRPAGIHTRNRSVSFDKDVVMHHRPVSDTVLQQPTVLEGHDEGSTTSRISAATRPTLGGRTISVNLGQLGRMGGRQQSARKLTIDDILGTGKYESEAETSILKALEEQQYQNHAASSQHQRYQSETSTILSGVPGNLVPDFSEGDSAGAKSPDDSAIKRNPSNDEDDSNTHSSRSSQMKQQSTPLIHRERAARMQSNHRKTMSVEDRLAGLTFAMWNMEDDDQPHLGASSGKSGDQFGKNVSIIASHELPMPLRNRLDTGSSNLGGGLAAVEESEEGSSDDNKDDSSTASDDEDPNVSADVESNRQPGSRKHRKKRERKNKHKRSSMITGAADKLKDDLDIWKTFFRPRREHMMSYMKRIICWVMVPFIGIAAILFYFADNTPTGKAIDGEPGDRASASWWLLFVVRQVVTATLALGLQVFVIDFLCIGTKGMLRLLGPLLTLLVVQSKGWPFVVFCWSVLDFGLLYGDNDFVKHWGYWQDLVGLFNEENPSGGVVGSDWNKRVLLIGATVSVFVALKRFLVGLLLGRQTFHHYGEQLAKIMNKMVLIGEVAQLSKRILKSHASVKQGKASVAASDLDKEIQTIKGLTISYDDDEDDNNSGSFTTAKTLGTDRLIDTGKRDPLTGSLAASEKAKLMQLVDHWEEPDRHAAKLTSNISISSVLKFRNALTFIRNDYPFSYAFGLADSRESCIDSSQEVYNRLLLACSLEERVLQFETLALCALREDGTIDQRKAKELIRVFRPDRDGCLSILDFVKSTDVVYKEFRLLQASVANSSQIDRAFENIVNIIFYTIVVTIIMSQLGFDPFALFLSLSSIILAFAFMIGSASSKYFEGLLFILVRRPYGIGDLIHTSNVESNTHIDGSTGWMVQHVTLFETVVTWLPTQETASLSNGSLANSRIINWARSPNARFVIFFVCPIETKYETLELFKRAVEEYIKVRPREWLAFNAFRVIGVFADQGYMKIEVVVQHRDSWQNIGQILDSRGNFISFCHEVQKILGMEYHAPPLPVDLSGGNFDNEGRLAIEKIQEMKDSASNREAAENDMEAKTDLFRSAAQERHNLKIG